MCSIHLCSALTKAIFLAVVTIQCEATTRPTLPNLEDHTTEQAVDTYTPSSVDNTDRTCDGSATIWGIYGQQHFYVQSRAACQDLCIASADCNFIQYQPSTSNLACHLYMDCATKRHCSGSCERTLEKASQACRDIVPKGQTVWHDSAGHQYICAWYASKGKCSDLGDDYANFGYTANEACCSCGGGRSQACRDIVPNGQTVWHDSDGHQYTCAWYASKGKCSDLGDDYANFGYTANQACCSCGGGKASTPWPTFATATDLKADAWGVYFTAVYGDVPQTGYPFSVVDKVWMLYNVVLNNAKANAAQSVGRCPPSNAPKGVRYNMGNYYQASDVSWLWHPYPYDTLAANTWREVIHEQDPFGDEHFGCWFMYAPGSGMYFNIGTTLSFQEHDDAYNHFGITTGDRNEGMSKAAAAAGYDSIQFLAHQDAANYPCDTKHTGTKGFSYMGIEILGTKLVGTYACGDPTGNIPVIKAGWQGSRPCVCDNNKKFLNCQGVPQSDLANITNVAHVMV